MQSSGPKLRKLLSRWLKRATTFICVNLAGVFSTHNGWRRRRDWSGRWYNYNAIFKTDVSRKTIPVSTASVERSFSSLKRIKTYARNMTGQTRLSALASMSMENDLLVELKRTDKLYNRVIEVFLRKEREDGLCVQISSRFGEYKAFYLLLYWSIIALLQ